MPGKDREVLELIQESNATRLRELRKWDAANVAKDRPTHAPLINAHEQSFSTDERLLRHQYDMVATLQAAIEKNGNGNGHSGKGSVTICKGLIRIDGLEVRDIYRFLGIGAICFYLWMIYSDKLTIHLHSGADDVTESLESEVHNH